MYKTWIFQGRKSMDCMQTWKKKKKKYYDQPILKRVKHINEKFKTPKTNFKAKTQIFVFKKIYSTSTRATLDGKN